MPVTRILALTLAACVILIQRDVDGQLLIEGYLGLGLGLGLVLILLALEIRELFNPNHT